MLTELLVLLSLRSFRILLIPLLCLGDQTILFRVNKSWPAQIAKLHRNRMCAAMIILLLSNIAPDEYS